MQYWISLNLRAAAEGWHCTTMGIILPMTALRVLSLLCLAASKVSAFVLVPSPASWSPISQQPQVYRGNVAAPPATRGTPPHAVSRGSRAPIVAAAGGNRLFFSWNAAKRRGFSLPIVRMAPSAAESEEAVTTGRGEHYHEELAPYEADVAEGDMELKEDAEGDEEGEGEVKAEEEEEEEEEEVDPLAETKQLIKDLEAELVAKEEQLTTEMDAAQEKGQTGFLRVAATMENLRKKTTKGSGHYEMEAKADVLTAVLPVFAAFEAAETDLKFQTENEIKYGKSYQSIYRQLGAVYEKIGTTDFFAVVGEKFDVRRHERVSEEYCDIMKANDVMECLSPGLELDRNVIKKAKCVVSLGPEPKEEEAAEEAEGDSDETPAVDGGEGQEASLKDAGVVEEGGEEEGRVEGGVEEPATEA